MKKEFSLKAKITLPIISITFVALGLLTYFAVTSSFATARADAEFKVSKSAEAFANTLKADLDASLMVTQQLEAYLGTLQKQTSKKDRQQINDVLKEMLVQAPSVFGVWALFEPNAFDKMDSTYLGQQGYEKSGAFGPYWNRSGKNGEITWENDVNYTGEFYVAPKKVGRRILTEPYHDEVNGQNLLMTSAVAPLFENNQVIGVVGIDLLLSHLDKQIDMVKPYETSVGYLISDSFKYITNPDANLVGKAADLPFAAEEFKTALADGHMLLRSGKDSTGKEVLNILVPITVPFSKTSWGVLISTPVKTVLQKAYDLLWKQLAIFLACLLAMGVSVVFISHRISQRFISLTERLAKAEHIVTEAIDHLSRSGQNLANSTTDSAASIEQTVSSLEELTAMVQKNTMNAREAARISGDSNSNAERGNTEMAELVGAMSEISSSSQKISEITNVIDDLSFQTNLLALNASVEAARAGEHGKGFAVVAEAVRSLAQKSASAAKDINNLIKESLDKVQNGSHKAEVFNSNLKQIVGSVQKVSHLNLEISAASDEQTTGIEQINKTMSSLDQVIQTNAASAQEISTNVQEILNQAHIMKGVVAEMNAVVRGS